MKTTPRSEVDANFTLEPAARLPGGRVLRGAELAAAAYCAFVGAEMIRITFVVLAQSSLDEGLIFYPAAGVILFFAAAWFLFEGSRPAGPTPMTFRRRLGRALKSEFMDAVGFLVLVEGILIVFARTHRTSC